MKWLKFVYAAIIVGIGIIWGVNLFSSKEGTPTRTISKKTQIMIPEKIIDVGKIIQHVPARARFEILNSGINPLIISDIKTDCNCTVPYFDSVAIMPGKSTYINLMYNAHAPGFFQKKAFVTCNIDSSPVLLIIRGKVIGE